MRYMLIIIGVILVLLIILIIKIQIYLKKMNASIGFWKFVWDYVIMEPITFIFRWIPGALGLFARKIYYTIILKELGKDSSISDGVKIVFPERIKIGKNCNLNGNVFLDANGEIEIGDWVRIGANTSITTVVHNHEDTKRPMKKQGITLKKVRIEKDVIIGVNAIILPGVTIGRGSYIGAGAVVMTDIPNNSIAIGNPARVIKKRQS